MLYAPSDSMGFNVRVTPCVSVAVVSPIYEVTTRVSARRLADSWGGLQISRIVSRLSRRLVACGVTRGTYLLVYDVPERLSLTVGAMGSVVVPSGGYVYVGSAFGSGGFSRIDRHERVASGTHDVRHWHVDYLGGHDSVRLVEDRRIGGRDVECLLAQRLTDGPLDGFGASDCDCPTHLARYASVASAREAVTDVVQQVGE